MRKLRSTATCFGIGAFGLLFVACVGNDVVTVTESASSSSSSGTTSPTEPAPKVPGAPADSGSMTPQGAKSTCYPDADGDGYPGPGAAIEVQGACPVRTTAEADPLDCNDALADAHPGQQRYFSSARNGFDYDCNGNEDLGYFDSSGRQRTKYTGCESASNESECTIRYNERTNGSVPPRCGQATDGILACMWSGGSCGPSAFEPITVRCR